MVPELNDKMIRQSTVISCVINRVGLRFAGESRDQARHALIASFVTNTTTGRD